MTTVFYKKLLGRYEITKISEHGVGGIQIEFEEPIDGNVIICDETLPLLRGVCNIDAQRLEEGYIIPKLYTGGLIHTVEGFIIKRGEIIRRGPDEEYVRRLSEAANDLLLRVERLEKSIAEIQNKIERKIIF
ncbi:MAG: hypothetical protein E7612_04555 [Ruminococcaceae bacterium]|nr:hypothetical protein [Oscillospiraceae bacterium]